MILRTSHIGKQCNESLQATRSRHSWLWKTGLILGLGFALAGCGRQGITVYEAPKDAKRASLAPVPHDHAQSPNEPGAIAWTAPGAWIDKGASGMRAGSYGVTNSAGETVDISVISLRSWTGQELQNVNRWRAQVGLQPLSPEELSQHTEWVTIAGERTQLFDMAGLPLDGDKTNRIIVSVLPMAQVAWYFKMTGDDVPVLAQKPAFIEFLKSVHFGADEPAPSTPAGSVAGMAADSAGANSVWALPEGWQEVAPGPMQRARFTTTGTAEATLAVLSGDGGGLLANVNRWRKQLGLAPTDAAELAKMTQVLDGKSGTATVVDMTAADKSNRIVAVVVDRSAETWFFRLSGPDQSVESQKAVFLKFVQSVP